LFFYSDLIPLHFFLFAFMRMYTTTKLHDMIYDALSTALDFPSLFQEKQNTCEAISTNAKICKKVVLSPALVLGDFPRTSGVD